MNICVNFSSEWKWTLSFLWKLFLPCELFMHPSFSFKTQRSSQIQEQRRIRWKSKRTSTVLSTSVYIWHKTNKERSLNKTFIPSKESRGIREWNEDRHHCQSLTFFPSLSNETSVKSHCQGKQSTDGKISTKRKREAEKENQELGNKTSLIRVWKKNIVSFSAYSLYLCTDCCQSRVLLSSQLLSQGSRGIPDTKLDAKSDFNPREIN